MALNMKYTHPTQIPMSKKLFFDWIGDRIPVSSNKVRGDTHPMTWADDGNIYTGVGDPNWMVIDGKNCTPEWNSSESTYRGISGQVVEKIYGEPESFQVSRVHDMPGYTGGGGHGPKPSGMICVKGALYYAVQNLLGLKTPPHCPKSQHGSDATIICSSDYGKTWTPELNPMFTDFMDEQFNRADHTWKTTEDQRSEYKGWRPMFPGYEFGGPSFVQYGKNNEDAVDDYVYAISGDQWDNGRFLRLGRVPANAIMDRSAWEFASLDDKGQPIWHSELSASGPILEMERHISLPEMVYIRSLNKYILLTWGLHTDFRTPTGSELTVLESDRPWGPFSLVFYEWMWYKRECCAYTPRIPLKWFNQETLEGYILHSGNWETITPYYLPQIRKFRLSVRIDDCR